MDRDIFHTKGNQSIYESLPRLRRTGGDFGYITISKLVNFNCFIDLALGNFEIGC